MEYRNSKNNIFMKIYFYYYRVCSVCRLVMMKRGGLDT